MNNKSQITLFIIAGIILIALVAIVIFIRHKSVSVPNNELREDLQPVVSFVDDCLTNSLEDSLREIGANGGYINELSLLKKDGNADYNSNYISFDPQKVAYWYHLKKCKESSVGCIASERPPLCREGASSCPIQSFGDRSIQEQLETIIPLKVKKCLNNFDNLQSSFEISQEAKEQVKVTFGEEKVFAELEMPLVVKIIGGQEEFKIKDFATSVDLDFTNIYKVAFKLSEAEKKTQFLERLTLHLLNIYASVDGPIPPMRHVSMLGQKHFWLRSEVQKVIEQEILPWTSFVQVADATEGYVPITVTKEQASKMSVQEQLMYTGIYQYLTVRLNEENDTFYNDLSINFYYPYSEMYLRINGGQEVLKPRSADTDNFLQKLIGAFMNDYRFRYDIAYPIITTIKDDSAFLGKGYSFSIGLEPNIYHNKEVSSNITTNNLLLTSSEIDISSPNQLVDNLLVIDAVDKLTGEPLKGASVSYRCGADYYLANTGSNGELVTKAPYCRFGGAFIIRKEGYMGDGFEYNNYEEGVRKDFKIELWPIQKKKVEIMKRNYTQVNKLLTSQLNLATSKVNREGLKKEDLVIFTIKRIPENSYQEEIPLIGFYTFTNESQKIIQDYEVKKKELEKMVSQGSLLREDADDYLESINNTNKQKLGSNNDTTKIIEFVPGNYEVEAFLIHNDLIQIPEAKKSIHIIGSLVKKSVTLNATNFTSWMSGGIRLLDDKVLNLAKGSVYNDKKMVFYVLEEKLPETWDDLENYLPVEDYLANKEILQRPSFE